MAVARGFTAECTLATLILGSEMMCDDRFWKNGQILGRYFCNNLTRKHGACSKFFLNCQPHADIQ